MITDESWVPEMRIWSILLIKSDFKWCIHLSRSLFLNLYDVNIDTSTLWRYRRYRYDIDIFRRYRQDIDISIPIFWDDIVDIVTISTHISTILSISIKWCIHLSRSLFLNLYDVNIDTSTLWRYRRYRYDIDIFRRYRQDIDISIPIFWDDIVDIVTISTHISTILSISIRYWQGLSTSRLAHCDDVDIVTISTYFVDIVTISTKLYRYRYQHSDDIVDIVTTRFRRYRY